MIIDGKKIATQIQEEIRQKIETCSNRKPCLAVILVGEHAPSQIYVNRKMEACEAVGIRSLRTRLPVTISQGDLLKEIERLNQDPFVDGILVQLPLPPHINPNAITHFIRPDKDVDGFHPLNAGKLLIGETDGFVPCTPLGIKVLLQRYLIEITGKHALIIGRSNIVGKPMAALLMQSTPSGNATVTVAHRYTKHLESFTQSADLIIVAIGQPKFLKAEMIKEGAVVIDVGINKITHPTRPNQYQIVGDADFDTLQHKCSYITPVPGGVGPMTIAMLLHNTLLSYELKHKHS